MNGFISYEGGPGKGSKFTITFPKVAEGGGAGMQ